MKGVRRPPTYDDLVTATISVSLASDRTTTILAIVLLIACGVGSYLRTTIFRRQAGANPWGIHPIVWSILGFLFGIIGLLLALVACLTTRPRAVGPNGGPHDRFVMHASNGSTNPVSEHFGTPAGREALAALPPPAGTPPGQGPPAGWHPDPADPRRLRLWSGADWTDEVLEGGVVSRSPLPPFPG
jgi:hypothetical protein